jgi:LmbE family N-acetylglucosaminyl deacetylase
MAGRDTPTRTGPVLAVFAHPDDAEISCGGTLARWAAMGREVSLLVLTNGDRGSNDAAMDPAELAIIRLRETEAGAARMGLTGVAVQGIHDGELENTAVVREAVVRRIREVRAETVVSCDPTAIFFQIPTDHGEGTKTAYNHSDHRTAGAIALDAVFPGSGNPHFFPEHLGEGLEVREVHDVWLAWTNEPNHAEDVTSSFDAKIAALGEHVSQISEGIRMWDEWMRGEARAAGARAGVGLAEEFRVLDLS